MADIDSPGGEETAAVVQTAVWLCSDEASFITGQILAVDGGYTIP